MTGRWEDGGNAVQIPGERRRAATGRGRGRPSRGAGRAGAARRAGPGPGERPSAAPPAPSEPERAGPALPRRGWQRPGEAVREMERCGCGLEGSLLAAGRSRPAEVRSARRQAWLAPGGPGGPGSAAGKAEVRC